MEGCLINRNSPLMLQGKSLARRSSCKGWERSGWQTETLEYLHNCLGRIDGTENAHPPATFAF
jgi:hypothetical protein